jgi:single-strand DNA-binding protein
MNRVFLVGRVGGVPDVRRPAGGRPWCALSVATHGGLLDGGDWHEVRVFGADAEACAERLRVGAVVAVEGALVYDKWTDATGGRRKRARVLASRLQVLMAGPAEPPDDLPAEDTVDVPSLDVEEPTVPHG